jgi:hypothetical protein
VSKLRTTLARLLGLRPPPGRWHPHAGGAEAGVVLHDPVRAQPGANLVVAGHAPEAFLIDAAGGKLHHWTLPNAEAFGRARGRGDWRRAQALADGSLLVCCTRLGVLCLDRDSRPLWRHACGAHHDFALGAGGEVHVLIREAEGSEWIATLGPDGAPRRRVSVAECFARGLPNDPLAGTVELHHPNAIEILAADLPAAGPAFRAGAALVSFRTAHRLALLDLEARRVSWIWDGPWREPHSPRAFPDGRLLVFDNLGGAGPGGRSRVLELDPARREVVWTFAGHAGRPFDSAKGGACQRLANGNTLVTESARGRAFEVTRAGERVWEYVHPARAGRGRWIPYLAEVTRLPEGFEQGLGR